MLYGLVTVVAGVLLGGAAACTSAGPDPEGVREMAARYDPDLDCTDTRGLFPAEIRTRTDNAYVDRSPHELQFCFNCANFIPPPGPGRCGRCRTVKGPINPLGWCKAWTATRV